MYTIFKKTALDIDACTNTTASRYLATVTGKAWRKFRTRNEARTFKRTLKNPTNYAIVSNNYFGGMNDGTVVVVR